MNESEFEPQAPPQASQPQEQPKVSSPVKPMLIFGIGMIFIGVISSLDILGIADMHVLLKLWPLILVFMGIAKIRQDGGSGGYALLLGGIFALIVIFGHGRVDEFIGPLILVGLGIFVIVKSLNKHRGISPEQRRSEDIVSGSAIFSGFKRRVFSQAFKGGELTSIFGSFDVDLRKANIQEGPARIDIFVLFGGGELRVPEDWRVDIQASAIFGAIEDKTHTRGEAFNEAQPRLIVTGMALFGGVEVSH